MENNTWQKINNLLETGEETNIELGLQLAQNEGVYEEVVEPYRQYTQWANERYKPIFESDSVIQMIRYIVSAPKLIFKIEDNEYKDSFLRLIPQLKNLEELVLSASQFDTIPKEITALDDLKVLWLDGCNLRDLTPLAKMTKLEILQINKNPNIESYEPLEQLINLEELDISNNNLKEIPSSIYSLNQLKVLHLEHNLIALISSAIKNMQVAQWFLSHNEFQEFPLELLQNYPPLVLYLDHNKIKSVPDDIIKLKNRIVYLRLNDNQIARVPNLSIWKEMGEQFDKWRSSIKNNKLSKKEEQMLKNWFDAEWD